MVSLFDVCSGGEAVDQAAEAVDQAAEAVDQAADVDGAGKDGGAERVTGPEERSVIPSASGFTIRGVRACSARYPPLFCCCI